MGNPLLWGLLLGGLLVRIWVAWHLPVGFDEVYYYVYSRHLSWSYFDHPAMVALTTGLGWWLTGTIAPFTLRWGALLLYPLSLGLLYLTGRRLYDDRTGTLAVAIATLAPLLWLAFGTLTAPDNGLMLFWSLSLYIAAVEFLPPPARVRSGRWQYHPSWRLGLLGVTLGLAVLSKYHGFVLVLGLAGFTLTRRPLWRVWRSPWLAAAIALFLLTLTPLWWWNSQHDWISFRFHLLMRFEGGEPSPFRPLDVIGTWLLGIAYLFPSVGFPLWWATGRSLWRQAIFLIQPPWSLQERFERDRQALILWVSLPLALGFTLLGGKQAIYPAWPAPGFWGLTLLLAAMASQWRGKTIRRWLVSSGGIIAALITIALLHLSLGILQQPSDYALFGGFVPAEQDGSTALLDTGQLRKRLAATPQLLQAVQQADFVFTDEFYLSAYVDMAIHPLSANPITCFSQDPRGFVFWYDPTEWLGQNAVYVTLASLHPIGTEGTVDEAEGTVDEAEGTVDEAEAIAEYAPYFETVTPLGGIPLTRGGTPTETVLFFSAETFQEAYPYPY
jgi:4-amino-4-deoxy-L-arabinose transferase-like glycosyltransferase